MNKQKDKKWTEDRDIQWELALDAIKEIKGILARSGYYCDNEEEIKKMDERSLELHKEKNNFDMYDDEIVKAVNDTYWPLIKKDTQLYREKGSREKMVADKDYEMFLNTKVDYSVFGK